MNIQTSQKTTTAIAIAMDSADVKDLLVKSLRAKLNLPEGFPGVTAAVDLAVDADGAISAVANIEIEASASVDSPADKPVATTDASAPPASDGAALSNQPAPTTAVDQAAASAPPVIAPGFAKPSA